MKTQGPNETRETFAEWCDSELGLGICADDVTVERGDPSKPSPTWRECGERTVTDRDGTPVYEYEGVQAQKGQPRATVIATPIDADHFLMAII